MRLDSSKIKTIKLIYNKITSKTEQSFWIQPNIKKKNMNRKYKNRLAHESSLYLQQHAENPVDWFSWGEEALKKAKTENKLLLISIGYSSCHWCHVMAHESFENEDVAKIMNEHFVCIKIDREQRPDIDQIYMTAVQLLTGRGGWPLNCIALPNGQPFFGGTYFQTEKWKFVLNSLANLWKTEPQKIKEVAGNLEKGLKSIDIIETKNTEKELDKEAFTSSVHNLKNAFDFENGGFGGAPKFPMPGMLRLLFRYYFTEKELDVKQFLDLTLQKMSHGGIYDQIGGGFSRYSVDNKWNVPHFEKMLYDNSQLVSLYAEAFKLSKNEEYKLIVYETLEFIANELTSHEGAFFSALDADSEGHEGKYYVWTETEIDSFVSEDSAFFKSYFGITKFGNWENGKNILFRPFENEYFIKKHSISTQKLFELVSKNKQILIEERQKRIKPALDDKILCSWNALMLIGYLDAYEAFSEEEFLQKAIVAAHFIEEKMLQPNGKLLRAYKDGNANIDAFLDDYAFVIQAFIQLSKNIFNNKYIEIALKLTNYAFEHFFDTKSGMFYYSSNTNNELYMRKMELNDNVIPSSNAIMATNLYTLSILMQNNDYLSISKQMLANIKPELEQNAYFKYQWNYLYSLMSSESVEIIITGKKAKQFLKQLNTEFLPGVTLFAAENENNLAIFNNRFSNEKTLIYICRNKTCNMPVESVEEALNLMKGK